VLDQLELLLEGLPNATGSVVVTHTHGVVVRHSEARLTRLLITGLKSLPAFTLDGHRQISAVGQ